MTQASETKSSNSTSPSSSLGERVVALLGAVAVLTVIGSMFWLAIWGDNSPPDVEVEFVRVVPSGDDYLVEILVTNHGGTTAAGSRVQAELMGGGRPVETSEVTIDFVPRQSEVQAGLYFSKKPTKENLKFAVGGYNEP